MPRFAMVAKTIKGKEVSHTDFQKEIMIAIAATPGGAKVSDIIPYLGEEYRNNKGRQLIGQTLINMRKRGTIALADKEEPGRYVVTVQGERNSVSNFAIEEETILDVIRQHGGFCLWRDIVDAAGLRPLGDRELREAVQNDAAYARLTYVIARSTRIRQDFGKRGLYNLPWAEVNALPLTGRWALACIRTGVEENDQDGAGNQAWYVYDLRDKFYEQVGATFAELRTMRGMEITDLLERPRVAAALSRMKADQPAIYMHIRSDWKTKSEAHIARLRAASDRRITASFEAQDGKVDPLAERASLDAQIALYEQDRERELSLRTLEWVYKRFEEGEADAHYAAKPEFYYAVAEVYEVCPASLSRGLISPMPLDARIRPERTRRHQSVIDEIRTDNEIAIERMQEGWEKDRIAEEEEKAFWAGMDPAERERRRGLPVHKGGAPDHILKEGL